MGWLVNYRKLSEHETPDSYLRERWKSEEAKGRTIIASATVGNTWYAALQIEEPGKPVKVRALVYLFTRGTGRDGDGFGYKSMDEGMGPNQVDCPARILNLLTPLDENDGYAKDWREACRASLAKRSADQLRRGQITPGTRLKLAKPITYRSGLTLDTFTIVPTPPRNRGIVARADGREGFFRLRLADIATATVLA